MREILFKAKRIDNGEWVIGNLIYSEDAEEGWEAIIMPLFDSNMFTKGGAKGNLGFENWYRVDKDTICQYTGLTDKNGNKIWENDVIKTKCGNVRVIYSAEPSPYENNFSVGFEVLFNNTTDNENYRRDVGYWACYRGFGVIGNIFDNPELLGV